METKSAIRKRARLAGLVAAVLYTVFTLIYLRPVWQVWQSHIAPVPEDSVFNLWVLKWGVHQIRLGLPDVWNANIYYPARGTLAFSDHLLGPAFQLFLFELAVPNAIAGYNVLFVTSFIASALATAWVARRSGASGFAALLAGWMFAFSPFRLQHLNHIQMLIAQWIPFTLWWWDRLLAERTPGNAARFLVFYVLHVTGGCYLAYMIHVPLLVLLANRAAVQGRELFSLRSLRVLAPVAVVCAALLAMLFLPYWKVSRSQGLSRNETEIGVLGAALPSYLSPSPDGLYFGWPKRGFFRTPLGAAAAPFYRTENALFAGFLPTLFLVVGLVSWLRPHPPSPPLPSPPLPPGEGGKKQQKAPEEGAGRRRPSPGRRGGDGRGVGGEALLRFLLIIACLAWLWGDLLTLTPFEDRPDLPFHLGTWGCTPPAALLAVSLILWAILRRRSTPSRPLLPAGDLWLRGIALSGLACCALTFPILYVPLARIVPGLDGMRSPARFYALVSLTVALFAARGIDAFLERLRTAGARRIAGAALAFVLIVELAPKPVRWVPLLREEEFPPVYAWIARQPDVRALVELPLRRNWRENVAMYYSTLHWRPIANGYSGYEPASHRKIAESIRYVPDHAGLELLRSLGITHVLIHTDELGRRRSVPFQALDDFERTLASGPDREADPIYRDDTTRVYRIRP